MPTETALSRVNTIDLFAVVLPGTYLASNIFLLVLALTSTNDGYDNAWQVLYSAVEGLGVNAILLLVVFGLLLGSLARAFSVSLIDGFSGRLNKILRFLSKRKKRYNYTFPYFEWLSELFESLGGEKEFDNRCKPPKSVDDSFWQTGRFNYWKVVICKDSSELFSYTRAAEARVRMFTGIVWATFWSSLLSLFARYFLVDPFWHGPLFWSWVVSIFLAFVFTVLLRPMRHEESRAVYLAFLSLNRKK